MAEKRFAVVSEQSGFAYAVRVLVDKDTGVNYLYYGYNNMGGGLTPLLDEQGKVVVMSKEELRQYE